MDYCFDIEEGIGRDKSWLSKLTAFENTNSKSSDNIKTLTLKAESEFIRDWINSNYLFKLESIAKKLGYELCLQGYTKLMQKINNKIEIIQFVALL